MNLAQYIDNINQRYKLGNATEHTYRGDLQQLLESMVTGIAATNEPQRISCGAPDYILTRKGIPAGYIEAKNIGENLNDKLFKEQFDRYKASLDNLILTDYIDFQFYIDGGYKTAVRIAEIRNGKILPLPDNFAHFETLIKDFCAYQGQTIKSSRKLAEMMAAKARMLADVIEKALDSDEENEENSSLKDQFLAFRQILIHDINAKGFADVYAQTIAYGMFAARLHDTTLNSFTRQEAADLIPKTNPFLRKLFQYVAGYDLDSRISWIVDGLADVFRATDVAELLKNFGSATRTQDPIIHFYETFLTAYDPALRKARGVWYTPVPIVNFIVRAIDYILITEFGIAAGLADNSMTTIKVNVPGVKNQIEKQVHRVQFLDPATGTATFIAELIRQIHAKFKGQEGIWSDYVEKHLIPRLNGFEILMASYAMAHLKLDLLLRETGYVPKNEQRFRIYLTNSLEEHHADTGTLFANWLSTEANEANHVKRDTPVMVVTGNPPYSVSSTNKSEWIENLTADYKKDLNERNIQPLSDDYIKFIRFGQHFIDKNGEGILAYISNNSFLDGIIHRQMRKHLLQSFDKIYILDLHGNAKKKEVCPDGSPDQNVFDIMQGVSISIFVKTGKKKKGALGEVFHFDLFGKREVKYDFLNENSLKSLVWNELKPESPNYYLVKKDFSQSKEYEIGFKIDELYILQSLGIEFGSKEYFLNEDKGQMQKFLQSSIFNTSLADKEIENRFGIRTTSGWLFSNLRKQELVEGFQVDKIKRCANSPFDTKFTYHSAILRRPQLEALKSMYSENIALVTLRQSRANNTFCYFLTTNIYSKDLISILDRATGFPLYLYPEIKAQQTIDQTTERTPNLNSEIVKQIAEKLGLRFTNEKEQTPDTFAPIDLLDYIYAVLHSPTYRDKYKEFLKIDFPRVPYPKDAATFWKLIALGSELRQIHLLESLVVSKLITQYPVGGSNMVGKVHYDVSRDSTPDAATISKVFINETQYFANVPQVAWEFYIGGYQPAQKWLKDRKERELLFDDILHYQKIIVALTETDRLMKEIDKIESL
ncbi:MAG: type ISP restriction/modification enzyme [Bacteroidales bacterium]|nr:type ISP restriction/modification enzyme [Bacteroidales bacterium]